MRVIRQFLQLLWRQCLAGVRQMRDPLAEEERLKSSFAGQLFRRLEEGRERNEGELVDVRERPLALEAQDVLAGAQRDDAGQLPGLCVGIPASGDEAGGTVESELAVDRGLDGPDRRGGMANFELVVAGRGNIEVILGEVGQ